MAKKKRKKRGGEEEDESEETGGGRGKLLIGLVGLALAGGAVYQFVLAPAPEAEGAAVDVVEEAPEEGLIFPMAEIVVNLADDTESRYLRIGMALVLEEGVTLEEIEPESPRAIDAAIDYLSDQTFAALRQPGSKTVVRDDLSARIRAAFGDEMVLRVLLTTLVMQ